MPSNRKSYNGAYNVPTKGKAEQEMMKGGGGNSNGSSKPSGGGMKPAKSSKY